MLRRRKVLTIVAGLGILSVALVLLAWGFPQQILCVDSGNVQADALVVLGGGSGERPIRAAELFQDGAAARIIVSGAGDGNRNKRLLVSKGVPPAAITLEAKSTTTRENAQFSIPLLRAMNGRDMGPTPHPTLSPGEVEKEVGGRVLAGARRVIIVTSWYHSRRALHAFQHYAPDIQFYSRPSYYGYPRTEWSREGLRGHLRSEYVKLAGYWVFYGICPL